MPKKKTPETYQPWIEARERYRLSDSHIQMARELGLSPKKFDGLANTRQEPWKLPLPEFIEELYFKHFNRRRPDGTAKQFFSERLFTILFTPKSPEEEAGEMNGGDIAEPKREKNCMYSASKGLIRSKNLSWIIGGKNA